MKVEELIEIADWILTLPMEERFDVSPRDFLKLASMLKKYKSK